MLVRGGAIEEDWLLGAIEIAEGFVDAFDVLFVGGFLFVGLAGV